MVKQASLLSGERATTETLAVQHNTPLEQAQSGGHPEAAPIPRILPLWEEQDRSLTNDVPLGSQSGCEVRGLCYSGEDVFVGYDLNAMLEYCGEEDGKTYCDYSTAGDMSPARQYC